MEGNTPKNGPSDAAIRFNCSFCGQHIRVPKSVAGKKGRCPKCKNVIIIPQSIPPPQADEPSRLKDEHDLLFQPLPPHSHITPENTILTKEQQFQVLQESAGLYNPSIPPPERKYPSLIDVFLYPANKQGLIFIGIVILIPIAFLLLFGLLSLFLGPLALLVLFAGVTVNIILWMYVYWFLAQCIIDSASGNLRVPDTIAETPGFGELFWQLLRIFACFAVCVAPVYGYYKLTHKFNWPFWTLAGCGAFLYPMTLLAVVMFDSIEGLNPRVIFPSIFAVFFQYCGLLILIAAILAPIVGAAIVVWVIPLLYPFVKAVGLYLFMVASHLLGRFYFKYQGKLNWEV